jgi:hypothetical protein
MKPCSSSTYFRSEPPTETKSTVAGAVPLKLVGFANRYTSNIDQKRKLGDSFRKKRSVAPTFADSQPQDKPKDAGTPMSYDDSPIVGRKKSRRHVVSDSDDEDDESLPENSHTSSDFIEPDTSADAELARRLQAEEDSQEQVPAKKANAHMFDEKIFTKQEHHSNTDKDADAEFARSLQAQFDDEEDSEDEVRHKPKRKSRNNSSSNSRSSSGMVDLDDSDSANEYYDPDQKAAEKRKRLKKQQKRPLSQSSENNIFGSFAYKPGQDRQSGWTTKNNAAYRKGILVEDINADIWVSVVILNFRMFSHLE